MKERRPLRAPMRNVFKMREEQPGCGFPVCAMIDMKPKRFKSLCRLIEYMKDQNMVRRVLHIQKGDCADASKHSFWTELKLDILCSFLYSILIIFRS